MNSDGCRFTSPRDNQRLLPLIDRPMPGTSTATSSAAPSMNRYGASACHTLTGTWKAITPAARPATTNTACRARKYHGR